MEWNSLETHQLEIGQQLRIIPPDLSVRKEEGNPTITDLTGNEKNKVITHQVVPGETLFSISRKYHVSVDELKKWNHLLDNSLSVDQQLTIGSTAMTKEDPEKEEENQLPENTIPIGFEVYQIQTGETLETISAKFYTSIDSILYWNRLKSRHVDIGQKLVLRSLPDSLNSVRTSPRTS